MEQSEDIFYQKLMSGEMDVNCPVRKTLELLNGKWKAHIIFVLCHKESYRFGELKKILNGITNTMLTSSLRELEELGIIKREQFNEMPLRVEYSLTGEGKALLPIFGEMAKWGARHFGME